ncbi:MAG: hypothetical protein ACI4CC_01610 [Lachnospiraceae bacterium]
MREKFFKALAIISMIALVIFLSADPDKSGAAGIIVGILISGALTALFVNLGDKEQAKNDRD